MANGGKELSIDRFKCAACGACVTVCRNDALMLWGAWLEIKEERCNYCSACVNICPLGALSIVSSSQMPQTHSQKDA